MRNVKAKRSNEIQNSNIKKTKNIPILAIWVWNFDIGLAFEL